MYRGYTAARPKKEKKVKCQERLSLHKFRTLLLLGLALVQTKPISSLKLHFQTERLQEPL
jgi:hypothetical protein